MTPEEMSELLNGFARIVTEGLSQAIRVGGQGNAAGAGGNGGRSRRMDMKGFEGLEKFMVMAEGNPGRTVGELIELADPGDFDGRFRGSEKGSAEL